MKKVYSMCAISFIIMILVFIVYGIVKDANENKHELSPLDKLLKEKVEVGELIGVSYSNSGDMLGNTDSISVDLKEKVLKTKYANMHSDPLQVKEYKITNEDVAKIKSIVIRNNLPAFSFLEYDNTRFAYDAPTTHISLEYDNTSIGGSKYKTYGINYYYAIPDGGYELLNELVRYIRFLEKDENLIKEYLEESD